MPLDDVGPSKAIGRVRLFTQKGRENGDLAIPHPLLVAVAVPSVADRRIRAGCKRLEEEVVDWSTNDGGMGEHSPISSIVVCGRVGAVGGVGGPESQRRDSRPSEGSIPSSDAKGALEGRV